MIHEIAPHNLDITYTDRKPLPDSVVFFFRGEELLTGHWISVENREAQQSHITFPFYSEVREQCGKLTYLFALDGRACFWCGIEDGSLPEKLEGNYTWEECRFFRKAAPKELAFAAVTAMHLNGWYQKNHFCGACGHELGHDTKERMLRCNYCGNMVYPRINPAVIVGVMDGDRLLLTKYRGRAYKNYALVAGFAEIGESLEETVAREVLEETGLRVKNIRYYKSQPWGFADNILAGYYCEVDGNSSITIEEEELSVAEWFDRERIPVEPEDMSLTNEMIIQFKTGNV